jgi:hypothetical protein
MGDKSPSVANQQSIVSALKGQVPVGNVQLCSVVQAEAVPWLHRKKLLPQEPQFNWRNGRLLSHVFLFWW